MSEWNRDTDGLDDLIESLQKQATTNPVMALEVARAAYRRSLTHGLTPQQAYQAVIDAMRDVVSDPSVYADHVMMEGGRVASITRQGIYHKGVLVFLAADVSELAQRKREQILARPDIKKLDEGERMLDFAETSRAAPAAIDAFTDKWMQEHKELVEEERGVLMARYPKDSDVETYLHDRLDRIIQQAWNQNTYDHNAQIAAQRRQYQMIERILDKLPDEAFKLFDFVVREYKRDRLLPPDAMNETGNDQAIDRQVKVVSDAAVMLNELAKRNKPFPNFNAKDFTIEDLEQWLYGNKENADLLRSLKDEDFEVGPGYDADYDSVVYKFPDGWTIRELGPSDDECQTEGQEMQHCLRHTDEYHWHEKIGNGYSRIFSLRDPLNYPHATVEFAADNGMPSHDGTWYVCQGPYGKQDRTLDHFPDYQHRMEQWFESLKRDKNIDVQEGDHDTHWYGDDEEEEEDEHEPQHLVDYDERFDPPPMRIDDAYDLESYYDALKSGDSRFDVDEPEEGDRHEDDDGDYYYSYARGEKPEIDVEDVATEVFEALGRETEFSTARMKWGYEMMEALLYAAEHEQADYGGLNATETKSMQEAVESRAQSVMADVRPAKPSNGQLDFSREHDDWKIEDPEEHDDITAEGAKMVNAALNYFMTISTNSELYQGGFLPDPDDTYGMAPERAFNAFDSEHHKILPDQHPEEEPLGAEALAPLSPGEVRDNDNGFGGYQDTGRDPNRWRDNLYHEQMQQQNPALSDGHLESPNIIGTAPHPGAAEIGGGSLLGWTPGGHVYVQSEGRWVPMHPAGMRSWDQGIRAAMPMEPISVHPDAQRVGHVVEAADIGELAAKAFESLIARPDYAKLDADYKRLQALQTSPPVPKDVPQAQEVAAKLATHPITVARSVFNRLIRNENIGTYKLWPWVWREIKADHINVENWQHAIDIIKQAADMIADMRQHNRIPRGFDVNQLEFAQLEQWVYDNQPDHSDEWTASETVYTFKDGWYIAQVGADDCVREGELMGHCVGGYGDSVENGTTEIFSLRDPKGMPHATIELSPALPAMREGEKDFRGTAQMVRQLQGKSNRPPVDEYQQRIREWFNHNNRTSENQFVWGDQYGYGYDQVVINNLSDFYEWWEHQFKGAESLWHNIPQGGGIVITTEKGEYGLRRGVERSDDNEAIYVDLTTLNEQIIWALHVDAGRSSGSSYWRGHNEPQEMAQALYQLCWVTGESFEAEVDELADKSNDIEFENRDQNWQYLAEDANERLELEFGERVDLQNETLDGDAEKYTEEWEAMLEQVETDHNDYTWSDLYKFLTYCFHLAGIYPSHTFTPGEVETGARDRVEKSQDEPPVAMLPPAEAEKEFRARQLQPSLPDIQPGMLTGPELADPIPDEIKHMEDQRAIDMIGDQRPGTLLRQQRNRLEDQTHLTSLDAALAALSRPMEASTLDWTLERHPTAEGFWRIANMRMSSDGRAYHPEEEARDGFLTHVVANRDLLLDGYAVTDRTGVLALVPLQ